eukprot:Lithocolla_globosa_v1_NODE_7265_length_970_cov_7.267760.p1 type:complete len:118 gc:universal NODE_7265_length_970_cov_7.267760:505-152(-)
MYETASYTPDLVPLLRRLRPLRVRRRRDVTKFDVVFSSFWFRQKTRIRPIQKIELIKKSKKILVNSSDDFSELSDSVFGMRYCAPDYGNYAEGAYKFLQTFINDYKDSSSRHHEFSI